VSARMQEYVLRCGKLYMGHKQASRVSNPDKAVRFCKQETAEARARLLRGSGAFQLPWEVVPLVLPNTESEGR
jgi:hypothetical protein